MGQIPNLVPEVLKGTAISTGVFYAFQKRTSSVMIKNVDSTNPLLYHFQPASADSPFLTIAQGGPEETILSRVTGIHIKANAGQTALFEIIGKVDYLS